MTDATPKTSTVILTAPRVLTPEQRAYIIDGMKKQLPADVGVVVLDGSFTATVVGDAPVVTDLVAGELQQDETPAQILAELKGLRLDLTQQRELINHVGLRVRTE